MKISTLRICIIALFASLALTVHAVPGAGGGYRDTICQYNIATISDTGTGTWTILTGNPATTVINTPGRTSTSITGFTVPGTYAYQWQLSSRRDTVYVVVQAKPNAGPDQSTCATFPGGIVQMAATGTGTWSLITPAPGSAAIVSPGSPTTTINGFTAAGLYLFQWTNTATGCTDTALVTVNAKPNAGPDQTVSCYATATVNLAASGGAGVWTKWPSNPGSSTIANPNSASTTVTQLSAAGAYQFIWTSSNGCSDSMFVFAGAVTNDNCSGAQSLGTLPAPAACNGSTSGTNVGSPVSASGSNLCATPSTPFPYQNACPISITSPPKDVWYSFVASATTATVTVSGATFANPVINVWGGACGSLSGVGCARGSGGTATVVVYQLTVGSTYYIQVSGPDSSQMGTFNISAFASTDCAGCLVVSRITSTPPPVNGTYYPGQTVTFCYTISSWTQTSANWLHGIQVTLGSGWDASTLVPGAPPASCTSSGTWSWYSSPITSAATGNVFPPGFYYETLAGSTSGVLDANPGNNYGDNDGSNACTWTFCITVTSRSANCLSGQDLTVSFSTSGDGESGSWNSLACSNDPTVSAFNVGACCPPTLRTTGATCNRNDGTATATPTGTNGPWTFLWSNGVVQHGVTGPSTITGLTVGLITVTVVDIYNCQATASDSVRPSARPNGGGIKYVSCPELGDSAVMTAVGSGIWSTLPGNPGTSVILHPDSAHTPINQFSTPGTYYYQYAIGNCYDTVPVVVTAKPNGGPDQNICNKATAHMAASGTGTWAAFSSNPSPTVIANIQ